HIEKFWEPRMRRQILEFLANNPQGRTTESELSPITLEALTQHRNRLMPKG
ncbi:MAG: formate dehydrogenase subunit delta, partial [Pusillimonas sp.]|nr:formate dehydrogenase subunit delta [Pusillimonas sp.]